MKFICLGISHNTCVVDIREKYYLHPSDKDMLLSSLRNCPTVREAIIISTCNRTEIYAVLDEDNPAILLDKLCSVKGISDHHADLPNFYAYHDQKAVRHLLSVAAGLDSLIIGEKEILGQVKSAIELAREKRMTGHFLNILFNITIRTGKLARTRTEICRGGVSVSWAAVEMVRKTLQGLAESSVLVIGAGKMGQLAIGDLKRKGAEKIFIMNRTAEKGAKLAQMFQAETVPLSGLQGLLPAVDVCICSASAPYYLIEQDMVEMSMRQRQKPLLLIDLSVPRNIHPGAGTVPGVTLVGVDELDKVVAYNVRKRLDAVYEVERLITTKMQEFYRKISTRSKYINKDNQINSALELAGRS